MKKINILLVFCLLTNLFVFQSCQKKDSHIEIVSIPELDEKKTNHEINEIISDLNHVLELSPRNVYALFNKGNAYIIIQNYTEAITCYTEAIEVKPDFGEAYYNRGLMYLRMGNKERGVADLSKAGELGILPSYNVLKRMSR